MEEVTQFIPSFTHIEYQYNPRKLVYQQGIVSLYHYQSPHLAKSKTTTPLLVIFATINRPEILDLFPDQSLIGGLLKQSRDVYLLDWGRPGANDTQISMADYTLTYLDGCIQYILKKTRRKKLDLLAVCQGGVIGLCYAALSSTINKLILISTPVDFHTPDNLVTQLAQKLEIDAVMKSGANVPGALLTQFFISLKPFELVGKKYLRFADRMDDKDWAEKFLRVEKWLHDAPDQAAVAFGELIRDFYQGNKLIKGEVRLNGETVNLRKIKQPVLNIVATEDHIVPMSASLVLGKYVGTKDYTEQRFESGHIGIYVSEKVGGKLAEVIAGWL